jgi:trimethylamine--corrinoid protein Co-methyltransferase
MRLEVLSKDDIERVDEATMGVLERTGVAVYERQSLDVLEENGAPVDRASSRARLPERMVREALERAPSRVKLAGRHGGRNVELGSGRTYFTNSLQGIKVLQLGSGEVRDSLLSDIPVFAKLVDALPNIDFYGVTVVAHDVPGEFHYLKELAAAVENTTKHIEHGCHGTAMAKAYVRIAQVVSGGEEELRKNPAVSSFGCPVSPLQFDRANTEAMVECAKAGMPYDVLSMAMAGASSPMTLAGTLTMINAEVLAGMTICELLNPGTPVIYGSVASIMDMRTGVMALGAPERPVLNGAVVQMAHSYGLPSLVGGMSTDGKLPGPQVLMEKAITGLPPALAGSDVVFGAGLLDSATTYSPEQLVIDNEVAGAIARVNTGMTAGAEDIAQDLIERVGPGGSFLGTRHTMEHMRKSIWTPELCDRNIYDNWLRLGAKGMREKAGERAKEMLEGHGVKPLDKEQKQEIEGILGEASKLR